MEAAVARRSVGRRARQTGDAPVLLPDQPLDDVASDHSKRTDDYGLFLLTHVCQVPCDDDRSQVQGFCRPALGRCLAGTKALCRLREPVA